MTLPQSVIAQLLHEGQAALETLDLLLDSLKGRQQLEMLQLSELSGHFLCACHHLVKIKICPEQLRVLAHIADMLSIDCIDLL